MSTIFLQQRAASGGLGTLGFVGMPGIPGIFGGGGSDDDDGGDIFGSGGTAGGGGRSGAAIGIIRAIGDAVGNVTRGITGNYQPLQPIYTQPPVTYRTPPQGYHYDNTGNLVSDSVGGAARDLTSFAQNNLGLIVVVGLFVWAFKHK